MYSERVMSDNITSAKLKYNENSDLCQSRDDKFFYWRKKLPRIKENFLTITLSSKDIKLEPMK